MAVRRISARVKKAIVLVIAVLVIGVIIWLDLNTGVWNDVVIIAGLAAGLVSFLLTALVLDRILVRSIERKWAPVSRLALTEFLHAIADEERSEISRGHVVTRLLPEIEAGADRAVTFETLHALRQEIVKERSRLAETLSRWAEFLSSSGNNELVLRHIAEIAMRLDTVRDTTLEAEADAEADAERQTLATARAAPAQLELGGVNAEIRSFNSAMLSLENELRTRIAQESRLVY